MSTTWFITGASRGLGRELTEQLERFVRRLDPILGLAACHPRRDRHRRDRADPLQALVHRPVQLAARVTRALDDTRQHVRGTRAQDRAEPADLLLDPRPFRAACGHASQTLPASS